MIMIIGGAAQGKAAYAKAKYPNLKWIDGAICEMEELFSCSGVIHFHEYIRRYMEAGRDVKTLAEKLIEANPELVIVTDEIGYGVVPMDRFLREYREQTGRVCTELAGYSEQVIRVICGIPMSIK